MGGFDPYVFEKKGGTVCGKASFAHCFWEATVSPLQNLSTPNFLPTEIRFVRWPRIRFHPEHSTIPQQIGRNGELAGGTVGPECGEFLFLDCYCWLSYGVTNV